MAHQRLARSCQGTKLNNISEKNSKKIQIQEHY